MIIHKISCDNCKTETHDIYAEEGWIRLVGSGSSSIKIYITSNRPIPTRVSRDDITEFDFCSIECLVKYLQNLK